MSSRRGFTPLEMKVSNRGTKRFITGFTLIELLVVIAIIALLMAILMPALQRVNKQAKTVLCRTNLRQWGVLWAVYTEDNDGKFPAYLGGDWMLRLIEYYSKTKRPTDEKLLYCPMTTKTMSEGAPARYAIIGNSNNRRGSYAVNEWVYDSDHTGSGRSLEDYWRSTKRRGLNNIPIMGDGAWRSDGQPYEYDDPPAFEGQARGGVANDEIRIFCVNRHDAFVNVLFMDWSTRKVGLKELWTLKWYVRCNTAGPWTKAGDVLPNDWPEWMRNFKDY
ncbi:MAG: prepilin-type N-terminal cleavage/methylation domain-containing protein [Planctomycetes bacterium]|nr:prepilin-type N-terminal cleavage/methylation domain-containing protein [Planctomycetota bacterium]MCH8118820.1 prepilin-type N-terminal cleavage/methylation domain-containing protein [Planctomycetota bacterium]